LQLAANIRRIILNSQPKEGDSNVSTGIDTPLPLDVRQITLYGPGLSWRTATGKATTLKLRWRPRKQQAIIQVFLPDLAHDAELRIQPSPGIIATGKRVGRIFLITVRGEHISTLVEKKDGAAATAQNWTPEDFLWHLRFVLEGVHFVY